MAYIITVGLVVEEVVKETPLSYKTLSGRQVRKEAVLVMDATPEQVALVRQVWRNHHDAIDRVKVLTHEADMRLVRDLTEGTVAPNGATAYFVHGVVDIG